jgi:hypothetical protein
MTDTVTHVAGPVVEIDGRIVQRCACCGEKLADNLNCAMPLNPDGTPPAFPTWTQKALVQIEGNRMSVIGEFGTDEIPHDFCLALVE